MVNCLICQKEFNNNLGLGKHIIQIHKIKTKDYFDNFLKKENFDKCLICNRNTRFEGLQLGYRKYCSTKCLSNDTEIIKKRKQTNLIRFGVDNPLKNKDIFKKAQKTFIKNYGVDNPSKSESIKKKKQQTCLQKYGVDNPSKVENILFLKSKKYEKVDMILTKNNIKLLEYIELDFIRCICENQHHFTIRTHYLYSKDRNKYGICPICYPKIEISNLEKQLLDFISLNYSGDIIENSRHIISPYELDIFLPELKLAFEFNGLYWHSELNKPKDYHKMKTDMSENRGIQLVHIYEDDWLNKQDIVKSRILNLLGKSEKILSEECFIKRVSIDDVNNFLENNHLDSSSYNSNYNLGLYYMNNLVLLTSMKRSENKIEILRLCDRVNISVTGGFEKLFNFVFKKDKKINEVMLKLDRSWNIDRDTSEYNKLNFQLIGSTAPQQMHVMNKQVKHRTFNSGELIYKHRS